MPDEKLIKLPHHVILEGRRKMSISGVEDVESFDEKGIICRTSEGLLIIKGNELHIDKLNIEGGQLNIEGIVDMFEYQESEKTTGGFWSRVFG